MNHPRKVTGASKTHKETRRAFLKRGMAASTSALLAPGTARANPSARPKRPKPRHPDNTEHIQYDYEKPYDYGVDKGTVDMRWRKETFYNADQKRLIWAQQHMGSLVRSVPIRKGKKAPTKLYPLPLDFTDFHVKGAKGKPVKFNDWIRGSSVDGLLALYLSHEFGPLIAIERLRHGMQMDSLHSIWSVSKSLAAVLVFHALAKGRLKSNERLVEYVPEFAEGGLSDCTVEHAFNMRSGTMPWDFASWAAATQFRQYDNNMPVGPLTNLPDGKIPDGQVVFFVKTTKRMPSRPHGRYWDYKDQDAFASVEAARRALGGHFPELYSELVYSQIGAQHDASILVDQHNSAMVQLGISITLRDLGRMALQYLPKYGGSALPKGMIARLMQLRRFDLAEPNYFDGKAKAAWMKDHGGYDGLHWQYPGKEASDYAIEGGGWRGQYFWAYPHMNVAIVQFASNRKGLNDIAPQGPAFLEMAKHIAAEYHKHGL